MAIVSARLTRPRTRKAEGRNGCFWSTRHFMGADMTRWLQAAKSGNPIGTKLTEPTQPRPQPVLSVKSVLSEGGKAEPAPARADGLDPDAGAYLDRLRLHGPATYGAMASAMGWGATRAWQAEAKLRAAGFLRYHDRRAHIEVQPLSR
jgi:hypothetical protein